MPITTESLFLLGGLQSDKTCKERGQTTIELLRTIFSSLRAL